MATHHGKAGKLRVGASDYVTEVVSFRVSSRADVADDSAMGDTWKSHLVGLNEWNGQADVLWDETDTNGQVALTVGASVTISFMPEGSGSGATYLTGTATVTSVGVDTPLGGVVTRAIEFQGNGALQITTVA